MVWTDNSSPSPAVKMLTTMKENNDGVPKIVPRFMTQIAGFYIELQTKTSEMLYRSWLKSLIDILFDLILLTQ